MKSSILAAFGLCLLTGAAHAQAQHPSGTYLSESGETRVRIARCGQASCGTIVAVRGDAKDTNDPDAMLRERSLVGIRTISDIRPSRGFTGRLNSYRMAASPSGPPTSGDYCLGSSDDVKPAPRAQARSQ